MGENESAGDRVVVSHQPVVDYSHLTAPEQLAAISRIEHVALVIVPESLAAAYAAIPSSHVAATMYVPDGVNVRVHTGALVAGGDGIGAADDVLIVTGMLIITSRVTGPVPKRIHVVGSVLAPRGSEAALGPALASGTGGVSYYTPADLMQDVFLRVWQHLEKLTDMPDDRQRAWIFTVARNLSVDAHRHQHTQAGTEQALAYEPARPPPPASAAVIAAERVAVVGEAIRRLPEPQRVTLTMAAAGGMTSAELAVALGVPAGTVRYRLSLARRAVAEALDRYDDPTGK